MVSHRLLDILDIVHFKCLFSGTNVNSKTYFLSPANNITGHIFGALVVSQYHNMGGYLKLQLSADRFQILP